MNYIALNIAVEGAESSDIIVAELAEFPFESFQTEGAMLCAYIEQGALVDCKSQVDDVLAAMGVEGRYIAIETQNWNAVWESQFQAVEVDDRVVIRAPFHAEPTADVVDIVIMPKMSFGTGHHATTFLMCRAIVDMQLAGKRGLDMGSGTGVLAILAAKCGAESVDAVDIDDWAYDNSQENIATNGVEGVVNPILGGIEAIAGDSYDFILANINRNILLAQIEEYRKMLSSGGEIVMSGFLEQDVASIQSAGEQLGMMLVSRSDREGWQALHLRVLGDA